MAQVEQTGGPRPRRGVRRAKRVSTRIDMTPMVDLGFLLICFFVVTTTMSEPRVAKLYVPKDGAETPLKESKTLTVIAGSNDRVFYYAGKWEDAVAGDAVKVTSFSYDNGIGNVIREKQQQLRSLPQQDSTGNKVILVLKASDESSYSNFIDMLDEVMINDVDTYMIADLSPAEKEYVLKGK